jgi:hypothetical protein
MCRSPVNDCVTGHREPPRFPLYKSTMDDEVLVIRVVVTDELPVSWLRRFEQFDEPEHLLLQLVVSSEGITRQLVVVGVGSGHVLGDQLISIVPRQQVPL